MKKSVSLKMMITLITFVLITSVTMSAFAEMTIDKVSFYYTESELAAGNYTITIGFDASNVDALKDEVAIMVTKDEMKSSFAFSDLLYVDQALAKSGRNSFTFDIQKGKIDDEGFYIKIGATNKISAFADETARELGTPTTQEKVAYNVLGSWNDNEIDISHANDKMILQLYQDGVAYGSAVELNSENNFSYQFSDLDKYSDVVSGTQYTYTVVETAYSIGDKTYQSSSTDAPYLIGKFKLNSENTFVGENTVKLDVMYGDVNQNGRIQINDALYILKYCVKDTDAVSFIDGNINNKAASDVSQDGQIQTNDAIYILKYCSKDAEAMEKIDTINK